MCFAPGTAQSLGTCTLGILVISAPVVGVVPKGVGRVCVEGVEAAGLGANKFDDVVLDEGVLENKSGEAAVLFGVSDSGACGSAAGLNRFELAFSGWNVCEKMPVLGFGCVVKAPPLTFPTSAVFDGCGVLKALNAPCPPVPALVGFSVLSTALSLLFPNREKDGAAAGVLGLARELKRLGLEASAPASLLCSAGLSDAKRLGFGALDSLLGSAGFARPAKGLALEVSVPALLLFSARGMPENKLAASVGFS